MPFARFDYSHWLETNRLGPSNHLNPLFEAIENAFNAVEESRRTDGKVTIVLHRDTKQETIKFEETGKRTGTPSTVIGIEVIDNGVGFDEVNREAFETICTAHKQGKGGKGLGRLQYLLAFERASFESHFKRGTETWECQFALERTSHGTTEPNLHLDETPIDTGTIVKLEGLDARIREKFPKRLQAIASHIVAHFFRRLSRNDSIECFLEDDWDGARIDLKDYCQKLFVLQQRSEELDVLGKTYTVTHVRCTPRAAQKHEVLYCAEGRVVCGKDLAATVTTTKSQLFGDEGEFFYAAYLEGPVLDSAARTDRMSFDLPEDDADRLPDPEAAEHPSIKRLHDAVAARAREFLKDVLDPLETRHKARIEAYCRNNVIFRPLLKHRMEAMLKIPMGLDDSEFAIQIQRVYNEWKMAARERFRQMAKTVRDNSQILDERRAAYQDLLRDMSQIAYYELASYVIDRRAVIEFLWERLRRNADGKFSDEDAIHDVFFPRKQTSDDVAWDESNLWLVDERLAYLQYVASDIELRKHGTTGSDSRDRPDVAIYYDRDFDLTFAFADGEIPFTSVCLLEFKKPERTKYTEEENPVSQAIRYIREIRAEKTATQDGHTFRVNDHTPIVVHVICHIVNELKPYLQAYPYFDAPDGQGILIQLPRMNATIQIVTFEKLIADARKRNDVFFRKLGVDVLPG